MLVKLIICLKKINQLNKLLHTLLCKSKVIIKYSKNIIYSLQVFYFIISKMQMHQQWIENRFYEHHLNCLQRIKSRKNSAPNLGKRYRKYQYSKEIPLQSVQKQNRISTLNFNHQSASNSQRVIQDANYKTQSSHHDDQEAKCFERNNNRSSFQRNNNRNPFERNNNGSQLQFIRQKSNCISSPHHLTCNENFFPKNKKCQNFQRTQSREISNISLKQQELLWSNFLIGKRILETSPVISKRKFDMDYQKHQQLLKSRTTKRIQMGSNFRFRKLQQHNDKIQKIQDDRRIQNNLHKPFMVNLIIKSIQIYKYKFSSFQNIILVMKHDQPQLQNQTVQKRTKQVSECISSSQLVSYNFFFNYKKKYFQQNLPIIIEIKNVKSLNVLSIGTFSFQFNQQNQCIMKEANLFNFGKLIGTVKFNAFFKRKNQFLSKIE